MTLTDVMPSTPSPSHEDEFANGVILTTTSIQGSPSLMVPTLCFDSGGLSRSMKGPPEWSSIKGQESIEEYSVHKHRAMFLVSRASILQNRTGHISRSSDSPEKQQSLISYNVKEVTYRHKSSLWDGRVCLPWFPLRSCQACYPIWMHTLFECQTGCLQGLGWQWGQAWKVWSERRHKCFHRFCSSSNECTQFLPGVPISVNAQLHQNNNTISGLTQK